ncbi:MAG: MBL fold metallo-hydrolase [Vicinamibacterales bacterium]
MRELRAAAVALAVAAVIGAAFHDIALAQAGGTVESHTAAARAAAGAEFEGVFDRLCTPPAPPQARGRGRGAAPPPGPPSRESWYTDPAKVFDNLYFVGEREYSAWAVLTSEGIIIIDPVFDYSVEEVVVNGLRKLGADPARIRYVLVSHAHRDHVGGARLLQERFNARVVMSAEDWDLLAGDQGNYPKPTRDVVATDGMKLTLGDTTLTTYLTPGHTYGTISTLIPVRDGGRSHVAALWGGTAFNWTTNPGRYVTPDRPAAFWFDRYIESAQRFQRLAREAGADVLIANHTNFDGSKEKIPALAARRPGAAHPYVVGAEGVGRYLTVAEACARAGRARIGA